MPQKDCLVLIKEYIDDALIDMRYAGEDNFTGRVIYDFHDAYLRYGTIEKLILVHDYLLKKGYRIKVWDAFRPVKAQFVLWDVYPVDDFVADPTKGFSTHSRGNTIDITLTDLDGNEILMPTGFDCFDDMAKYDYNDEKNKESAANALFLKETMIKFGFIPSTSEWWHFRDSEVYPVCHDFAPSK